MKIEAITPVWKELSTSPITQTDFSQWMMKHIDHTNQKLINSEKSLQSLAKGESPSLHQVMLSLEEAKLSIQLLEQVRSRALTAYQTMMKESI